MYLYFYSLKEDTITEIESPKRSVILSKIDSIDFLLDCEFSISKENSALVLRKEGKNFYISVEYNNDALIERYSIKAGDIDTFKNFLFDYIDELNYGKTVKNLKEYNSRKKELEKEKFEKWKVRNIETRKKEQKSKYFKISVTLIVLSFITICCFYLISGEYKFIGHQTIFVKAKIVEVSFVPVTGGYKENIKYEYIYNNKKFEGVEQIGKRVGRKDVGDLVKVKISTEKPEQHKIEGYYY